MIPSKREMHSNLVTHFDGHGRIKSYMEEAQGKGENLERAAAACFQMLQKEKGKGTLATHGFVRKTTSEKHTEGLLPREFKEVAVRVIVGHANTVVQIGNGELERILQANQFGYSEARPSSASPLSKHFRVFFAFASWFV